MLLESTFPSITTSYYLQCFTCVSLNSNWSALKATFSWLSMAVSLSYLLLPSICKVLISPSSFSMAVSSPALVGLHSTFLQCSVQTHRLSQGMVGDLLVPRLSQSHSHSTRHFSGAPCEMGNWKRNLQIKKQSPESKTLPVSTGC